MPTSANKGLPIPLHLAMKRDARKGALWKPHLMHRIRASMVGNAHPRFVYILHKQMPKPSSRERDWRVRLHGFPHVLHCQVEQAVSIHARPQVAEVVFRKAGDGDEVGGGDVVLLLEDVVGADVVLDVELLEVVGAAVVVVELLDVGAGVVVELKLVAAALVDPYRYVSLSL